MATRKPFVQVSGVLQELPAGDDVIPPATTLALGTLSAADKIKLDATSGTNTGDQTLPVGGTPALTLGTVAAAGSSANFVKTDATIVAFDANSPTTQAFGDTAVVGTAGVAAHRDHRHAMPATPKDTTAVTGVLKGNGANISAATAGTDYLAPGSASTYGQAASTALSASTAAGAIMAQAQGASGTAGAAFMTYHRPGVYATNFGLDTDNEWKFGGWSEVGVSYAFIHEKNYAVKVLGTAQTFTKAQRGAFTALADASTVALNLSLSNQFDLVLEGNRTLGVPSNVVAGQQGIINIYQDATGSRTLAYSWIYGWAGGAAGVLSTPGCSRDMLAYSVDGFKTGAVTMTIATPCVATLAAHGLHSGHKCQMTTTGALATGLAAATTYYLHVIDANTFHFCTSLANVAAGAYIATSGSQSGTHTFTGGMIGLSLGKGFTS